MMPSSAVILLCFATFTAGTAYANPSSPSTGSSTKPPAPTPSSDSSSSGGYDKPWWLLLILIACAFFIIIMVAVCTFGVSWCLRNAQENAAATLFQGPTGSERSELSISNGAWVAASTAVTRRERRNRGSAGTGKGASMELVQSLPVFEFKNAADTCAVEVVVDPGSSCGAPSSGSVRLMLSSNDWTSQAAAGSAAGSAAGTSAAAAAALPRGPSDSAPNDSAHFPPLELAPCSPASDKGSEAQASPTCSQAEESQAAAAPFSNEVQAACPVCLGEYTTQSLLRGLPCGHSFHVECVDKWLFQNASCPTCRHSLLQDPSGPKSGQ